MPPYSTLWAKNVGQRFMELMQAKTMAAMIAPLESKTGGCLAKAVRPQCARVLEHKDSCVLWCVVSRFGSIFAASVDVGNGNQGQVGLTQRSSSAAITTPPVVRRSLPSPNR